MEFNEKILKECELRLKIMEDVHLVHENVLREFKSDNKIYYSDCCGILYWLDNVPEYIKYVKDFEQKYNTKVYFAIETNTTIGKMLSMFYISNYEEDWDEDRQILHDGQAYCYVENCDNSTYSEFGRIGFISKYGCLARTF